MNKEHVLLHLREGLEELERTISELESEPDYDDGEFRVAMEHLYNHLNTAWNARNVAPDRVASQSDADFYAWRSFPPDLELSG